ncbi:restriction endonuclease [Erythrobacter dokdonensis]|uniref:restriction endonuclease n=1 Tax=Erythrobacter dokdonensis TaxID=328225 RepID=UPI00083B8EEF|nr:restriction endonuclease [Erythrobacter dokdonensis]
MIDLPRHDDFMRPTLEVLVALGGSATNEEIEGALIERLGLSPEQMSVSYESSGALIAPDRMSWARSYLKYPGFVDNPKRGVWVLTDEGRAALSMTDDEVRKAVAKGYAARHGQRKNSKERSGLSQDETEETAQDWTDALLIKMKAMDPAAFERLAQRILRESGFVKVEVLGKSGDGGIDGVGVLRMKLISFQVLFQCKRYSGSVSAGTVRDFRGAMQGRADKGLILTTGTFTPDARREATRDGAPAIDLIDGEALCQLLFDLRLGVDVKERIVHDVTIVDRFFDEL